MDKPACGMQHAHAFSSFVVLNKPFLLFSLFGGLDFIGVKIFYLVQRILDLNLPVICIQNACPLFRLRSDARVKLLSQLLDLDLDL